MSNKTIYKIILILTISVLMVGCSNGKKSNPFVTTEEKHTGIEGYYVYPERPLGGGKYYAIPKETLDAMTNEQLAQAVIDCPEVYRSFVFVMPEEGDRADKFREECDAYSELIQRKGGLDALFSKIEETVEKASGKTPIDINILCEYILDDMLLRQHLTMDQKEILEKYRDSKSK